MILNDLQIPYHDKPVVDLVLTFIKALRPHGVVLNGDVVDCTGLSEFNKDPMDTPHLNQEIADSAWLMAALADCKITERWWLGGNHEDRLRRYLWTHAEKFAGVQAVQFPQLFDLARYGFKWKPYGESVMLGKLMVTHGNQVLKHSGQSGKAHFDRYGTSVLIGHTHRLGIYYRRNVRGVHAAYENGCLCRLDPDWVQHPDWQQGISVVHVEDNGLFNVQQIPVLGRKVLFYGDTVYER